MVWGHGVTGMAGHGCSLLCSALQPAVLWVWRME